MDPMTFTTEDMQFDDEIEEVTSSSSSSNVDISDLVKSPGQDPRSINMQLSVPQDIVAPGPTGDPLPGPAELNINELQVKPSTSTSAPKRKVPSRRMPARPAQTTKTPAQPPSTGSTGMSAFEYAFGRKPDQGYTAKTSDGKSIAVGHRNTVRPAPQRPQPQRQPSLKSQVLAEDKGVLGGMERGLVAGSASAAKMMGGLSQLTGSVAQKVAPFGGDYLKQMYDEVGQKLVGMGSGYAQEVADAMELLKQQGGQSIAGAGGQKATEILTGLAPSLAAMGITGGAGLPAIFAVQEMANARARGVTDPLKLAAQGAKGAYYGKVFGAVNAVANPALRLLAQGATGAAQGAVDPAANELIENPDIPRAMSAGVDMFQQAGDFVADNAFVAPELTRGIATLPNSLLALGLASDEQYRRAGINSEPAGKPTPVDWGQVAESAVVNVVMDVLFPGGGGNRAKVTGPVDTPTVAGAMKDVPTPRLLEAIKADGIAIPRGKLTRQQIEGVAIASVKARERLLGSQRQDAGSDVPMPEVTSYLDQMSTEEIRAEMLDRGIPFPPNTPRSQLIQMLGQFETNTMARGMQDPGYTTPEPERAEQRRLEDDFRGVQREGLIPEPTRVDRTMGEGQPPYASPPLKGKLPREKKVQGEPAEFKQPRYGNRELESIPVKGVGGARKRLPVSPDVEGGSVEPINYGRIDEQQKADAGFYASLPRMGGMTEQVGPKQAKGEGDATGNNYGEDLGGVKLEANPFSQGSTDLSGKAEGDGSESLQGRTTELNANPFLDPEAFKRLGEPILDFVKSRLGKRAKAKDLQGLLTPNAQGHSAASKAGLKSSTIDQLGLNEFLADNPEASMADVEAYISARSPQISTEVVKSVRDKGGTAETDSSKLRLTGPSKNYREVLVKWDNQPEGQGFKKEEHYGGSDNILYDVRLEDRDAVDGNGGKLLFWQEGQSDRYQAGADGPNKNDWLARATELVAGEASKGGYDGIAIPATVEQVYEIQRFGTPKKNAQGRWVNSGGYDITPVVDRYLKEMPKELGKLAKAVGGKLETRKIKTDFGEEDVTVLAVPKKEVTSGGGDVAQKLSSNPIFDPEFYKENLSRFMSKSKARDSKGNPLALYHGTQAETPIDAIDMSRTDPNSMYGPGFYMTQDPAIASEYTDKRAPGQTNEGNRSVYPLYADIRNPLDLEATLTPQDARAISAKLAPMLDGYNVYNGITRGVERDISGIEIYDMIHNRVGNKTEVNEILKEAGFDGLTHSDLGMFRDPKRKSFASKEEAQAYAEKTGGRYAELSPDDLYDIEQIDYGRDKGKFEIYEKAEDRFDRKVVSDDKGRIHRFDTEAEARAFAENNLGGQHISEGHKVWVAFYPNQVKSATGNRGSFGPDANINYSNPFNPDTFRKLFRKKEGNTAKVVEDNAVRDEEVTSKLNAEIPRTEDQSTAKKVIDQSIDDALAGYAETSRKHREALKARTAARSELKEIEKLLENKDLLTPEAQTDLQNRLTAAQEARDATLKASQDTFKQNKLAEAQLLAEKKKLSVQEAVKRGLEPDLSYRVDPDTPYIEEVLGYKLGKSFYSAAKDVAVASGMKLDPDIPVTLQMIDLANQGKVPLTQFDAILEKNGVSMKDFLAEVEKTASAAGRFLNLPSQISRAVNRLAKVNPELAKRLEENMKGRLPSITKLNSMYRERSNWDRAATIFQGALVATFQTAMKNIGATNIVVGLDTVGQLFDSAIQATLGPKRFGNANTLSPVMAIRPLLNFYGEIFGTLTGKGWLREKSNVTKTVDAISEAFPEEAGKPLFQILDADLETAEAASDLLQKYRKQAEELPDDSARKAQLLEAITKAEERYKRSQSLVTRGFILGERVTHALGWANRAQEIISRRAIFEAKIRRRALEKGIDLDDAIARSMGIAEDVKKLEGTSTARDKQAQQRKEAKLENLKKGSLTDLLTPEDINWAAQETLRQTMGLRPKKGSKGDFVNRILTGKLGFAVKVGAIPFPNFMLNNFLRFQYEHSPLGVLSLMNEAERAKVARGDMSVFWKALAGTAFYGMASQMRKEYYNKMGSKDFIPPQGDSVINATDRAVRAVGGKANLATAGDKWFEVKMGSRTVDTRFTPFSPLLFVADYLERSRRGLAPDLNPSDVLEAFGTSLKGADEFGGVVGETLDSIRDESKRESLAPKAGRYFGTIVSGLLTPLKPISDIASQFQPDENIIRDPRPTQEGLAGMREGFVNQLTNKIPIAKQSLPPMQLPTRNEPPRRVEPLTQQMSGMSIIEPRNYIEKEIAGLGIVPKQVLPKTGDVKVDKILTTEYSKYLIGVGESLQNDREFNSLPAERRRQVLIDIVFPGGWKSAKSRALAQVPEGYAKTIIEKAFTREQLNVENRRRKAEGKPSVQDEVKQEIRSRTAPGK